MPTNGYFLSSKLKTQDSELSFLELDSLSNPFNASFPFSFIVLPPKKGSNASYNCLKLFTAFVISSSFEKRGVTKTSIKSSL